MMNQILSIIVIAVPYIIVFVLYWVLFSAVPRASGGDKMLDDTVKNMRICSPRKRG